MITFSGQYDVLRILGATAALGVLACSTAWGQGTSASETLQWYKNRGDYLVPELRKEIRKGLSAKGRALEEQVQYDVVSSWNANAQAIRVRGVSRTGISAGLIAVIDWVSTALAASAEFGKRPCAVAYITHLTDSMSQNKAAAKGDGSFVRSLSFFAFAQSTPQLCSGITMARFRGNARADELRELWIAGSLDFILAHELGHHILTHTMSKPTTYPDSRARETSADRFAFKTMALAGMNPALAMPMVILWSGLEGYSIEGESTHPAGVRRMRAMLSAAKEAVDSDAEVKVALEQNGTKKQWDDALRTFSAQLEALESGKPEQPAALRGGPDSSAGAASFAGGTAGSRPLKTPGYRATPSVVAQWLCEVIPSDDLQNQIASAPWLSTAQITQSQESKHSWTTYIWEIRDGYKSIKYQHDIHNKRGFDLGHRLTMKLPADLFGSEQEIRTWLTPLGRVSRHKDFDTRLVSQDQGENSDGEMSYGWEVYVDREWSGIEIDVYWARPELSSLASRFCSAK